MVIDRGTDTVIQRILVGEYTISVAFNWDGSLAFASARDGENISIIDTSTYSVVTTLEIGVLSPTDPEPGNMALDPASKNLSPNHRFIVTFRN